MPRKDTYQFSEAEIEIGVGAASSEDVDEVTARGTRPLP
jgi:hypothetical protein